MSVTTLPAQAPVVETRGEAEDPAASKRQRRVYQPPTGPLTSKQALTDDAIEMTKARLLTRDESAVYRHLIFRGWFAKEPKPGERWGQVMSKCTSVNNIAQSTGFTERRTVETILVSLEDKKLIAISRDLDQRGKQRITGMILRVIQDAGTLRKV